MNEAHDPRFATFVSALISKLEREIQSSPLEYATLHDVLRIVEHARHETFGDAD